MLTPSLGAERYGKDIKEIKTKVEAQTGLAGVDNRVSEAKWPGATATCGEKTLSRSAV